MSHVPLPPLPLALQRVMRQIELQRRDGDVAVAQCGNVGVLIGGAQCEDAAVPKVALPARAASLFVRVEPRADALAADLHAGRLLIRAQPRNVDARDLAG